MSSIIEINNVVKNRLDEIKEKTGRESYSDVINIFLIQLTMLEDNRKLMTKILDIL